ncbi:uncharacterized protein LOC117102849, partial [Anneissia japonica]|uniref:uncharacterized protein LOC117102849 n=1 Tax=Anneissia japonica TaxID=1529436 RepID=UPI0014255563
MVVDEIKKSHPNAGEVYLMGHLRSRGIRVQRARIRKALQAVDPTGVQRRRTRTITRRIYSVPCPNYLWHIDGTHKMNRFVIHAGIDGFSIFPFFLLLTCIVVTTTLLKLCPDYMSQRLAIFFS